MSAARLQNHQSSFPLFTWLTQRKLERIVEMKARRRSEKPPLPQKAGQRCQCGQGAPHQPQPASTNFVSLPRWGEQMAESYCMRVNGQRVKVISPTNQLYVVTNHTWKKSQVSPSSLL